MHCLHICLCISVINYSWVTRVLLIEILSTGLLCLNSPCEVRWVRPIITSHFVSRNSVLYFIIYIMVWYLYIMLYYYDSENVMKNDLYVGSFFLNNWANFLKFDILSILQSEKLFPNSFEDGGLNVCIEIKASSQFVWEVPQQDYNNHRNRNNLEIFNIILFIVIYLFDYYYLQWYAFPPKRL